MDHWKLWFIHCTEIGSSLLIECNQYRFTTTLLISHNLYSIKVLRLLSKIGKNWHVSCFYIKLYISSCNTRRISRARIAWLGKNLSTFVSFPLCGSCCNYPHFPYGAGSAGSDETLQLELSYDRKCLITELTRHSTLVFLLTDNFLSALYEIKYYTLPLLAIWGLDYQITVHSTYE